MTYKPISPALPGLLKRSAPVLLDLAGFACIIIGVAVMFGPWAWLAAGVLLVLAGYRAQG